MKEQKKSFITQLFLSLSLLLSLLPSVSWSQGLEVDLGTDVTAAGGGYIIIDETASGIEMAIDGNEIQTTVSGLTGPLYLNREGGSVDILQTGGEYFSVDNDGIRFDLVNRRLGVNNFSPSSALDVIGSAEITGNLNVDNGNLYYNDATNSLGIGTTVPSAALDVVGEIECNGLFDLNGDIEIGGTFDVDNGNFYYDDTNNRVGIGTSTPGARLDVEGEIECNGQLDLNGSLIFSTGTIFAGVTTGITIDTRFRPDAHITTDLGQATFFGAWDDVYADDFVNVSDMRLKSNITDSEYGLAELLKMSPIRYLLTDDKQKEYKLGLSAQEVLTIIPEVVKSHDLREQENGEFVVEASDYLGIKYSMLVPVIIKAIKELDSKISVDNTSDGSSLEVLRSENEDLKQRVVNMEKQIQILLEIK